MQWEGFCRIGERHRSLTGGVEHFEEVHARRDHGNSLSARLIPRLDPEREPRPEQGDSQKRKGGKQEVAPPECIDGKHCRKSKDPVQNSSAHRCQKGGLNRVTGGSEDRRRIVGNDVHSAELLHEHDDPARKGRTGITRDGKELHEHCEEVLPLVDLPLELDIHVGIVEISGSLQIGPSEGPERLKGLVDLVVLDQPTRRLGAEVHLSANNNRKDHGRTEHEAPRKIV